MYAYAQMATPKCRVLRHRAHDLCMHQMLRRVRVPPSALHVTLATTMVARVFCFCRYTQKYTFLPKELLTQPNHGHFGSSIPAHDLHPSQRVPGSFSVRIRCKHDLSDRPLDLVKRRRSPLIARSSSLQSTACVCWRSVSIVRSTSCALLLQHIPAHLNQGCQVTYSIRSIATIKLMLNLRLYPGK